MTKYIGMISSDWNQCLAPCGPFDVFAHHYPGLRRQLERIFHQYTANAITLAQATENLQALAPAPLTAHQMDGYLQDQFETYGGVAELMAWCRDRRILFMINTTGLTGYFQRALSSGRLPAFPVLSANPLVRYDRSSTDPEKILDLHEITDKALNTASAAEQFGIPSDKIIIMGDSGGDGPHFEWGARHGATLVGSMTKSSLEHYCQERGIQIDHRFGHRYGSGEAVDPKKEMIHKFTDLVGIVEQIILKD